MKAHLLAASLFLLVGCAGGAPDPSDDGAAPVSCSAGAAGGDGASSVGAGRAGAAGSSGAPPVVATTQADVLFVVADTPGMLDEQLGLSFVVTAFLHELTDALAVDDLHVGVMRTSLGAHGGDACSGLPGVGDDHGRLVLVGTLWDDDFGVQNPWAYGPNGSLEWWTYQGQGFYAWDPRQVASPPGDPSLDSVGDKVRRTVWGVGELGCRYPAPLEAMYRFLVDPEPPLMVGELDLGDPTTSPPILAVMPPANGGESPFLRPRSKLVVVLLTDEDDCSVIDGAGRPGDPPAALTMQLGGAKAPFTMASGTAACATDPDDRACRSCFMVDPADWAAEGCRQLVNPSVSGGDGPDEDDPKLRCWDQKRRFGYDALYPIDRYVGALRGDPIVKRDGTTVPNPLFVGGRTRADVLFVPIVGIPAVDVAADGSIAASAATDPLLVAAPTPRSGTLPDGETLGGPGTWNAINGHDWWPVPAGSDLQYACTFPLSPIDGPGLGADCAAYAPTSDNPVCQDPYSRGQGPYGTGPSAQQASAKAYPAVRVLQVAAALGSQASVGSICGSSALAHPTYDQPLAVATQRLAPR